MINCSKSFAFYQQFVSSESSSGFLLKISINILLAKSGKLLFLPFNWLHFVGTHILKSCYGQTWVFFLALLDSRSWLESFLYFSDQ